MADHAYAGEFFLDPGVIVKQEPLSMDSSMNMSASMPIPPRKVMDMSELRDFGIEYVDTLSPITSNELTNGILTPGLAESSVLYQTLSGTAMWGSRINGDSEASRSDGGFRMDEDDIFQVDKADLIQGPTLAELNANDENLLEDLNFDDLLLPEESSYFISVPTSEFKYSATAPSTVSYATYNPFPPSAQGGGVAQSLPLTHFGQYKDVQMSQPTEAYKVSAAIACPTTRHSASSSSLLANTSSPLQQRHSTLHELLLKKETFGGEGQEMGQSVPGGGVAMDTTRFGRPRASSFSRLSSSAPTHLGLDQIWQRREPRQHLLSTGSLAEAGSTSSLSTGGILSPESHDFSHDEGFDSEDDSDHYEDFSSDGDSSDEEGGGPSKYPGSMTKKERYFWQYNVQAKGPKGQRLVLKTRLEDPHVLNEVTDPVFSPQCSVRGIKHSGKARKGDGNDLTPNARKLCSIGRELDKLSRIINDMTPVSELPFNVRPKTRKEKNKLASRACRLKKKAQHEANKLKLCGLEQEHRRLNMGILQIKQLLAAKFTTETLENQEELTKQIDKISKSVTKTKIAGFTTDFVNKILEKAKSGGVPSGLLDDI